MDSSGRVKFKLYVAILAGSGSGLVVSWEQETGILLASGDVRFIRVWDTQREMRMQVRLRNITTFSVHLLKIARRSCQRKLRPVKHMFSFWRENNGKLRWPRHIVAGNFHCNRSSI